MCHFWTLLPHREISNPPSLAVYTTLQTHTEFLQLSLCTCLWLAVSLGPQVSVSGILNFNNKPSIELNDLVVLGRHGGSSLKSQQSGSWGRRIATSYRPVCTKGETLSFTKGIIWVIWKFSSDMGLVLAFSNWKGHQSPACTLGCCCNLRKVGCERMMPCHRLQAEGTFIRERDP